MIGDNFMWIPEQGGIKVKGETSDSYFSKLGAFELNSFKFLMDNKEAVDSPSKTSSAAGKAKFQDFTVRKRMDTASVPLYKLCSQGTMIPTVMLASRKAAGGHGLLYMQYIFRYCFVTGITWEGGKGEDAAGEDLVFSFKAMGFQYISQKADGSPGTRQAWSWNTATQDDKPGAPGLDIEGLEKAPDFSAGLTP